MTAAGVHGQDGAPFGGRRPVVFLVADKNMEAMVKGFLTRDGFHLSLGCDSFSFDPREDLFVAAGHNDPGLFKKAGELTRGFQETHDHLVVLLDAAWDGSPGAAVIAAQMTADLAHGGWAEARFAVVVIDPELENWVWATSPHVALSLGWDREEGLREWLEARGQWEGGATKPADPKGAVEDVLREIRQPRSSAIYRELASRVSPLGCADHALTRLFEVLRAWFPVNAA